MTIRVKLKGRAVEVSNEDFKDLVRSGEVAGNTPVCGRIFADGEWWTAADLRMFHGASLAFGSDGLLVEVLRANTAYLGDTTEPVRVQSTRRPAASTGAVRFLGDISGGSATGALL